MALESRCTLENTNIYKCRFAIGCGIEEEESVKYLPLGDIDDSKYEDDLRCKLIDKNMAYETQDYGRLGKYSTVVITLEFQCT